MRHCYKRISFVRNFILATMLIFCSKLSAQKLLRTDLQTGDLLFQNIDCGEMCDAIEAVTQGWQGYSFSHVGLVELVDSAVYVWESMSRGVRRISLDSFMIRSPHPMVAGRLKSDIEN